MRIRIRISATSYSRAGERGYQEAWRQRPKLGGCESRQSCCLLEKHPALLELVNEFLEGTLEEGYASIKAVEVQFHVLHV